MGCRFLLASFCNLFLRHFSTTQLRSNSVRRDNNNWAQELFMKEIDASIVRFQKIALEELKKREAEGKLVYM